MDICSISTLSPVKSDYRIYNQKSNCPSDRSMIYRAPFRNEIGKTGRQRRTESRLKNIQSTDLSEYSLLVRRRESRAAKMAARNHCLRFISSTTRCDNQDECLLWQWKTKLFRIFDVVLLEVITFKIRTKLAVPHKQALIPGNYMATVFSFSPVILR